MDTHETPDALENPAAVAGHNEPPADPQVANLNDQTATERARYDELMAAAERAPATIEDDETAQKVVDLVALLKRNGKDIEARRKEAKRPLDEAAKGIQAFFKPYQDNVIATSGDLEQRLIRWTQQKRAAAQAELERQQKEAAEKLAAAESREEADAAIAEVENIETDTRTAEKTRSSYGAQTVTRKVKKWRLADIEKVPSEYLILDEKKLNAAAKAGIAVPGIEIYEEETLHVR